MGEIAPNRNLALERFMQYNYSQGTTVVKKAVERPCQEYKTLPKTVPEIKKLLLDLQKKGLILFGKDEIRKHIQGLIDSSSSDTHLMFGVWHKNPDQYAYINELLYGDHAKGLSGITHVVLEMFGQGALKAQKALEFAQKYQKSCEEKCILAAQDFTDNDLQYFIDLYQKYNSQGALKTLELFGKKYFKSSFPFETFTNALKTISLNNQNGQRYKLLAADISHESEQKLEATFGDDSPFLIYDAREYFSASYTLQEQNPSKKDVFLYVWGADHIDKYGTPKFIPQSDNVISIGLSGGNELNNKVLIEQAIKELGWDKKEFLVKFSEAGPVPYREFDLFIHLPITVTPAKDYFTDPYAVPYQIYSRPNTCEETNK